jgi:hypothetical protein
MEVAMVTRLILHLPWFLSAPLIVAGALVLAVGLNVVAGTYFERSFRDDADPLLGASVPLPSARVSAAPGAGPAASPGGITGQPAAQAAAGAAQAAPAPPAAQSGPSLIGEGEFRDGDPGHHGEGRARLIRGAYGAHTVRFEDFSVTNGPDLFVILSLDPDGSRGSAASDDAVNLGRLKATDGNVNYAVPEGTDVSRYRSVIVYCRAFKVVFAVATLEAR